MPEGDTILHAARRVGAALVGTEILVIETAEPRHTTYWCRGCQR